MRTHTSKHKFAIEPLERRRLLSSGGAVGVWTGLGDGVNWHDPQNWSQNTMPGINDDVVIDVPDFPTILVNQPVAVRSIVSNEALDLSSNLGVEQSSQFNAPVMLRGTFAGAGDATFASTLDWIGGVFEPGGKLIIAAGAEMNIDIPGGPPDVLTHELYRSLDNYGTVNVIAGFPSTLAVSGCLLDNKAGAVLNILRGSMFFSGDTAVVRNAGTLNISRETFVGMTVRFDNEGGVVNQGELHLQAEGSASGTFVVKGILSFISEYDLLAGSLLTGSGAVNFYATATVDGTVNDLNLLAIATAENGGVVFSGNVEVDHLICINESTAPDLLIATFEGSTVAGDIEVIAGHVRADGPLTAASTLVRAYQQRRAILELGAAVPDLGALLIEDSLVQLQSGSGLTACCGPSRSLAADRGVWIWATAR